MKLTEITHGSREYQMACSLRDEVLRAPLGLRLADEDLAAEIHQHHFGLFLADGTLVACATAVPVSSQEMKIRQMAVLPGEQGKGHGRSLMQQLMQRLVDSGTQTITLHARANVCGFYQSLGFSPWGEPFEEVGIPHVKMTCHRVGS
jgi:predicted GNAT family N-acyltransferase